MTTPTIHNDHCLKLQLQSAEYLTQWPNHCPKCYGWGYYTGGGDAVEYWGATTHLPDTQEPCEACVGTGKCPRCGELCPNWEYNTGEYLIPCAHCGYEYEVTDGQPDVECECWMEAIEK